MSKNCQAAMNQNISSHFIPIVLCAGLGTRLQPISNYVSKILMPINGISVAFFNIKALLEFGFSTVHVNLHHHAATIQDSLTKELLRHGFAKNRIKFWIEENILETGGGIANIVHALHRENPYLTSPDVLAISGDIYAEVPILQMVNAWQLRSPNIKGLMCVRPITEERKDSTWVNTELNKIVGFRDAFTKPGGPIARYLFTTHQIISADIVLAAQVIKESSIILFYNRVLAQKTDLLPLEYPALASMFDIGTYANYLKCLLETTRISTYSLPKLCLSINQNTSALTSADKNENANNTLTKSVDCTKVEITNAYPCEELRQEVFVNHGELKSKIQELLLHMQQKKEENLKESTLDLKLWESEGVLVFALDLKNWGLNLGTISQPILISLENLLGLESFSSSKTFLLLK